LKHQKIKKSQPAVQISAPAPVAAPAVQAASADIIKPLSNMRKVIGKRMQANKQIAPHVTITTEVNVDKQWL